MPRVEYDSVEEFVDRPRGILSPKERSHLLGLLDEDPDDDADRIRQREYRIRKHLRHSIIDFGLLCDPLGSFNISKDIARAGGTRRPNIEEETALVEGLASMFEFFFSLFGNPTNPSESSFGWFLKEGVKREIIRADAQRLYSSNPRVDIATDPGPYVPIPIILRGFEEDQVLLPAEINALFWADEIDQEQMIASHNRLDEWLEALYEEHGDEGVEAWEIVRKDWRSSIQSDDETPPEVPKY